MQLTFDIQAPKRATNLSINSDLLKQAKEIGINISQFVERSLGEQVKRHKNAQWLRENREAIQGYNAEVERIGVFGDSWRGKL
ncbi:MAG: type II toxin-antitoxin system CcdA family antitoxin [Cytophagales bacterium]|nr:type II toxin-antitoxin system CcdA family antitoxin [Cytophagales bacterium]